MKDPEKVPEETKLLIAVLNRYESKRRMNSTKARVDLLLLVAGSLNWEEEEFFNVIQQLSRVAISETMGINMRELEAMMQAAVEDAAGSSGKKPH